LTKLGAASSAIALARSVRRWWKGQDLVGVLLPPSVAGTLANVAAALAGKATVNLNHTLGREGMEATASQAGLRTVVTSRSFLESRKLQLPRGVEPIWLEEGGSVEGALNGLLPVLLALLAPPRLIERYCGARQRVRVEDLATVVFTSGSSGEPKGVMLTHLNVDSNVEAIAQVFEVKKHDRVLGILPLFHSFGNLVLWFATNQELGAVFHPNPLEAGAVGNLIQRYRVSMLIATPSLLHHYVRRCTPAQFGSLRTVLAGAEKLPTRLALAFEDHFGIRPLEGYGTTECSPTVTMSTLDYRAAGFYQPGSRRGSVGQPLPGVAVRIVDPASFEPLPPGTPGRIAVKGPNVMKGYLGREDLTAEVMRAGWFLTGDIGLLDEDGFLSITDRLGRFSKIDGEMVPHTRVEEALHDAAGEVERRFAVTSVPDERRGERLAVLHTLNDDELRSALESLPATGLPSLFTPAPDAFVRVEEIPLLGSGKLDLREIRRIAREALSPE
jgi:acyl-[acyl-carrier-protein]-phospholipid O-acyltransferase/long-chain-fatty-acid--[acyl-carrier-protein] ligase